MRQPKLSRHTPEALEHQLPKCPECGNILVFPQDKYLGHLVCPKNDCGYSEGRQVWKRTVHTQQRDSE